MANEYLKKHIIEIVNNQLRDNEPKCTRETFDRLITLEYTENQSKEMIEYVLTEEIQEVMKNQETYNEESYIKKLSMLPEYFHEKSSKEKKCNEVEIIQNTIVNGNKVGRNESCPCGSGKKYKKCCGK